MKKIIGLVLGALAFASCSSVKENNNMDKMVGFDKDAGGCKRSAGYTWSELEEKCIRSFEQEVKLTSVDNGESYTTNAAIIFKGNKAEVFAHQFPNSLILEKKSDTLWQNVNWKVEKTATGYIITQNGEVRYK